MSDFRNLLEEIRQGMLGKNSGLPMGFQRLNNFVSIRKSTYYLVAGYTGSGKSTLIEDAFILNPLDFILNNQIGGDFPDYEVILFSMERKKTFKLAKWLARKIFLDTGKVFPIAKVMGWVDKDHRIDHEDFELFEVYEEYIDALVKKVTIYEGPINPTGMNKLVREHAKENGTFDDTNEYKPIYTPNNPAKITLVASDHVGLTKKEKDLNKKETIDLATEHKQKWRDQWGYSILDVSQYNRDIANPMRMKNSDTVEPRLEDIKDTGTGAEAADVVLSLFDPMRYKVADVMGYDLEKLANPVDKTKRYRMLKILKNSYGADDVNIGLAFQPIVGLFKELKKRDEMTDEDYQDILSDDYFYKKKAHGFKRLPS